jgi:LacI family transcriptional regulator
MQHAVAHVGFDDVPLGPLLDPGLTVMAQDPSGIGTLAAERLLARIDGDASPPAMHTVATRLILRGSGELPIAAGVSAP